MRIVLAIAVLALPAAAVARSDPPDVAMARALKGLRPVGTPQSCVTLRDVPETRIIDDRTIVFRNGTNSAYVNHLPGSCPGLRPSAAFATRTPTDRLCSGDIIQVFDPTSHFQYGGCGLGEFAPYGR